MTNSFPDFSAFIGIVERLLASKLEAIRQVIKHAGEKGRSLEVEIINWLRTFLPTEYGLSTGFVVYEDNDGIRLSSQLDIIIYDALRSGPIANLAACEVFPLEAVYGYIEVKAVLRSCSKQGKKGWPDDSIEKCLDNNQILRRMRKRVALRHHIGKHRSGLLFVKGGQGWGYFQAMSQR